MAATYDPFSVYRGSGYNGNPWHAAMYSAERLEQFGYVWDAQNAAERPEYLRSLIHRAVVLPCDTVEVEYQSDFREPQAMENVAALVT